MDDKLYGHSTWLSDYTKVSQTWQRLTLGPENPLSGWGACPARHRMFSSNLASTHPMPAAPSVSMVTTRNGPRRCSQMFPGSQDPPPLETPWTGPRRLVLSSVDCRASIVPLAWLAEDPRLDAEERWQRQVLSAAGAGRGSGWGTAVFGALG